MGTNVTVQDLNEKVMLKSKVDEWKALKMASDIGVLTNELKMSRTAISNAINQGKGSLALLREIDKFYMARKALMEKLAK